MTNRLKIAFLAAAIMIIAASPAQSQVPFCIFFDSTTTFDGMADAGETKVIWDGRTMSGETAASGIYLYRLTADNKQIETKKMTLLK